MFFSFDWQVKLIISYLEDFAHRLISIEPRHYGGVFVIQKNDSDWATSHKEVAQFYSPLASSIASQ